MTRIDSPSNPRIAAALKAVATHEKMLLEGRRMIEEALDAGVRVEEVFVQRNQGEEKENREEEDFLRRVRERTGPEEGFHGRGREAGGAGDAHPRALFLPARVTEVSARVLRKLSDLPSTRGVVAIAAPPHRTLASLSPPFSYSPSKKTVSSNLPRKAVPEGPRGSETEGSLFLLLDDVQDPANVGAILRSGEAFGVAAALLTPGCAWPFSPRTLRASAGSAFRLPVAARVAATDAVAWARRSGIALVGAAAHGGTAPEALRVRPLALVIGSEGHGISAEIAGSLDHRVTLPLAGRVESLNAAVAAGVLLRILSRLPDSAR
jgi:RNA methyltransferase, TrmH family